MPDEIGINDVAEAQRWANIHHRMLCSDISHINELYERRHDRREGRWLTPTRP